MYPYIYTGRIYPSSALVNPDSPRDGDKTEGERSKYVQIYSYYVSLYVYIYQIYVYMYIYVYIYTYTR
jgi:hypothetical protein